jgi:hypothetical protein
VSACNKLDEVTVNPAIPTAGLRFINAMPDSSGGGGLDFRFIDFLENNAHFQIRFRNSPAFSAGVPASAIQYKPVQVTGTPRKYRIFLDDTLITVASFVLNEGELSLTADHNYTFIVWGYGRSTGADKVKVTLIDETAEQAKYAPTGDPGAGKVAVRVLNTTNRTISASQYKCVGTSTATCTGTAPGTPTWPTVAPFSASNYVIVDTSFLAVHVDGAEPGAFPDIVAMTGTRALCAQLACVAGQTPDIEATAGTQIEGSAVTAIVWPGSTPTQSAAPVFTPQGAQTVTGGTLTGLGYVYTTGTGAANALSAATNSYVRAAGSFITEGFAVGQTITVNGFATAANNGTTTVTAVAATALTVAKATVTEAFATGSVRSIAAPRSNISYAWDRRPKRCPTCG